MAQEVADRLHLQQRLFGWQFFCFFQLNFSLPHLLIIYLTSEYCWLDKTENERFARRDILPFTAFHVLATVTHTSEGTLQVNSRQPFYLLHLTTAYSPVANDFSLLPSPATQSISLLVSPSLQFLSQLHTQIVHVAIRTPNQ